MKEKKLALKLKNNLKDSKVRNYFRARNGLFDLKGDFENH